MQQESVVSLLNCGGGVHVVHSLTALIKVKERDTQYSLVALLRSPGLRTKFHCLSFFLPATFG